MELALRRRGVSVTGSTDPGAVDLVLEAADDASIVHGELFVHNFSGALRGAVTIRITDLTAHDGSTIAASSVDVEPPRLDQVDDRHDGAGRRTNRRRRSAARHVPRPRHSQATGYCAVHVRSPSGDMTIASDDVDDDAGSLRAVDE